jgi:hypothetical protein
MEGRTTIWRIELGQSHSMNQEAGSPEVRAFCGPLWLLVRGTRILDRRVNRAGYDHAHAAASAPRAVRSLVLHHLPSLATATAAPLPFGRLRAGFDCGLRTVREYNAKVEYIHWKLMKAGSVSRPEEWSRQAGSSVCDCTGNAQRTVATPGGLAVDRVLLPADERTRI